jgi:ribosomal protein L40E
LLIDWSSQFLIPNISLQSCARILLGEDLRIEYLKKMRNSKLEALKKAELMKEIVKKCNNLTSSNKAVKCSRCGYVNGLASSFLLLMILSLPRVKY